jgi:hypothetical protein
MHYTIAAPNTLDILKVKADEVCDYGNASSVINSAIEKLKNGESFCSGSISLMAGDYDITDSIELYDCLEIVGASMQQTKLNLKTSNDCFVSNSQKSYIRLSNFLINGRDGQGCGINGSFKQSTFERIRMIKMNNTGIRIRPTDGGDGMLNIIQYNDLNVVSGSSDAFGIDVNEKNYDTWIINNNIGSKNVNIRVNGGPFRITGNHCNGTPDSGDQPKHNLITELGLNSNIISNNIFENASADAIILSRVKNTDAGMLGNNLNISNNLIRSENLDADDEYSMIKFEKGNDEQYFNGVTITGNLFEQRLKNNNNSYKNCILLDYVSNAVVCANVINLDTKAGDSINISRNTNNILVENNANGSAIS